MPHLPTTSIQTPLTLTNQHSNLIATIHDGVVNSQIIIVEVLLQFNIEWAKNTNRGTQLRSVSIGIGKLKVEWRVDDCSTGELRVEELRGSDRRVWDRAVWICRIASASECW